MGPMEQPFILQRRRDQHWLWPLQFYWGVYWNEESHISRPCARGELPNLITHQFSKNIISKLTAILQVVHDMVHDFIGGPGGTMAYPDLAGLDPIFFFHHCNVDRILSLWQYIYDPVVRGEPEAKAPAVRKLCSVVPTSLCLSCFPFCLKLRWVNLNTYFQNEIY